MNYEGTSQGNLTSENTGETAQDSIIFAGFWVRFIALLVDGIILALCGGLIGVVLGVLFPYQPQAGTSMGMELSIRIFSLIGAWIYYAGFEASNKNATPGKLMIGIEVTDLDGNGIGFGKATGRYFGKIISTVILFIGYIMAGFTEKHQALHDMMAGCLVVKTR